LEVFIAGIRGGGIGSSPFQMNWRGAGEGLGSLVKNLKLKICHTVKRLHAIKKKKTSNYNGALPSPLLRLFHPIGEIKVAK
jgi:hypothetical protein